ncbi:hypothetical protein QQF64_034825 [Cirrhinus molitorella]|uniref:Integrase catalytic domain-containing protein n=1 Tax=Cirrhinus molitorella TaxID=172907 RepID=A0ABR3L1R9_9TELE
MQEVWKLLGIHAQLHISRHPMASGQVERGNKTVVSILKKYVSTNQKDWDIKLPLLRPAKAECSLAPLKEIPISLDRTSQNNRQNLACCLPNQNAAGPQRASSAMGPPESDKEASRFQPTRKRGRLNLLTQTDEFLRYTTLTPFLSFSENTVILSGTTQITHTPSSATLLGPTAV